MNTHAFHLHPRLAADTFVIGDLPLCRVLLMNDAHWPWLILVPRQTGARELTDLDRSQRHLLSDEIHRVQQALQHLHAPDKLNVAALGNVVVQLHIHVIARRQDDPAWPAPVWGKVPAMPYAADTLAARLAAYRQALDGLDTVAVYD